MMLSLGLGERRAFLFDGFHELEAEVAHHPERDRKLGMAGHDSAELFANIGRRDATGAGLARVGDVADEEVGLIE